MAILDIGQSVPKHGPPKMMQIAPIAVHQDSPNSTAEHTVMGLSSAKNAQSPGSVKRPQPPEAHTQNKKRNICDRNSFTDVSKDFGINSKEITLTRLASSNMSPRSHAFVEKAIRRSPSCEPSDPNRPHFISSEISITKVPPKDAANRDRRRDQEKYFSSPEKEIEKRDEPAQPTCSQDERENEASRFWSKSSLGTCRISRASNYLHDLKMEKDQGYEHCDMIGRDEDNWDDPSQYPYSEPPRLVGVLEENWDTYDASGNNQVLIQDHSNYSPDSAYGSMGDSEMSYLMLGFPNPPGENRCWLNASLHSLFATLFSLPVADDMQQLLQMEKCSKITLMLGDLHKLWRKGGSEKTRIYNTIKKFKESLSSVERTYCSDRQQDVSEFLMALLNHLKTEFDKFLPKEKSNEEREGTPEKEQPSPKDERKSPSPKISRDSPPRTFFDTSLSTVPEEPPSVQADSKTTAQNSENPESSENSESPETPESPESPENPIDKFFLQKIVEDYECKKCQKHREIPIENLMVYVDVPPENDVSSMDLIDAIQKTFAEEERNLICENCKHDTHKMKTFYKEFPKVMTIQINRYGITNDGMMNKICTAVTIPEKLCLDEFLLDNADDKRVTKTYEPICIISHVGSNMDCGHYTSYVKHDDQWFHYNDMSVMPMTSKEALSAAQSTAYLLFYVDSDLLDKPSLDCCPYSTRCSPAY